MEKIVLNGIKKEGSKISFDFFVSEGLSSFFSGKPFVIEYAENIEAVPDAVVAVPFVCSVLPIIWLTNSKLVLKELDEDFYHCIANVRKGYEEMFPETQSQGEIDVGKIVCCNKPTNEKTAAFFSGGVDSVYTMLQHLDEKPDLLAIWGADIRVENESGWQVVYKGLRESADNFALPLYTVRSSFREFDSEENLDNRFNKNLQSGYWYGVKHALGIIGHAAVHVWMHQITTVYIASSNWPEVGKDRCASDPTTDNHVRFCCCKVCHDGYESHRQRKIRSIIEYTNRNPKKKVPIHVCWESQSGNNCSNCEKCFRTMLGFWIEGADPAEYGFTYDDTVFDRIYRLIALNIKKVPRYTWTLMKKELGEKWEDLSGMRYRHKLEWMLNFDFFNLEKNVCRKKRKVALVKERLASRFPKLYQIYSILKKR